MTWWIEKGKGEIGNVSTYWSMALECIRKAEDASRKRDYTKAIELYQQAEKLGIKIQKAFDTPEWRYYSDKQGSKGNENQDIQDFLFEVRINLGKTKANKLFDEGQFDEAVTVLEDTTRNIHELSKSNLRTRLEGEIAMAKGYGMMKKAFSEKDKIIASNTFHEASTQLSKAMDFIDDKTLKEKCFGAARVCEAFKELRQAQFEESMGENPSLYYKKVDDLISESLETTNVDIDTRIFFGALQNFAQAMYHQHNKEADQVTICLKKFKEYLSRVSKNSEYAELAEELKKLSKSLGPKKGPEKKGDDIEMFGV